MKEKFIRIKELIKKIEELHEGLEVMSIKTSDQLDKEYGLTLDQQMEIEYAILYDIICDLETLQTEYIPIFTSHSLYKQKKNGLLR